MKKLILTLLLLSMGAAAQKNELKNYQDIVKAYQDNLTWGEKTAQKAGAVGRYLLSKLPSWMKSDEGKAGIVETGVAGSLGTKVSQFQQELVNVKFVQGSNYVHRYLPYIMFLVLCVWAFMIDFGLIRQPANLILETIFVLFILARQQLPSRFYQLLKT